MEKSTTEAECSALENTFHQIIGNMKMSFPALEDLTGKALKLNAVLRTTISATSSFLEAFQKVANLAFGSKGSTSEIGSMLIRLCLHQRAVEEKLKQFAGSISEGLVTPLQERLEEWKKAVVILDKDHAKESKKAHQDIKKALSETLRLKKKSKKPKPETAKQLEMAVNEYNEKYEALEVIERNAVRSALAEEYNCFCYFVKCLKPVMDCELAMMSEMTQVEQLMSGLHAQSLAPFSFSDKSSDLAKDVKKETLKSSIKVNEESPDGSQGSRKSSLSSASSSCVPSPLHISAPGTTPILKDRICETQDSCNTIIRSSSNQIISPQSSPSRHNCQDQARVVSKPSPSVDVPAALYVSEDSLNVEHQVACDSSFVVQPFGANQYAVPCAFGAEQADTMMCLMSADAYAKPSAMVERQISVQQKSVGAADIKRVQVVPLEGYVNMNQLACLAVQQQEMYLKNELTISGDKGDFMDLPPPPPPESPTDTVLSSSTLPLAACTSTVRRSASSTASRTAEDVQLSGASQRFLFGSATVRRAPKRDRSLPPISRKSSKTALLPLQSDPGQAITARNQSPFSSLPAKEYRKQMEEIYETCIEALPLPPPPVEVHRPIYTVDDSAIDNLPLPPPPEELRDVGFCSQRVRKSGSSEILGNRRQGSVVSSHASIIESLNVKFSERQTLPREAAAANFARGRRASDAMCVEDVKSRNEPTSPESLTSSIQRGIRLRRAVTNDRSAPRLPTNHL